MGDRYETRKYMIIGMQIDIKMNTTNRYEYLFLGVFFNGRTVRKGAYLLENRLFYIRILVMVLKKPAAARRGEGGGRLGQPTGGLAGQGVGQARLGAVMTRRAMPKDSYVVLSSYSHTFLIHFSYIYIYIYIYILLHISWIVLYIPYILLSHFFHISIYSYTLRIYVIHILYIYIYIHLNFLCVSYTFPIYSIPFS